MSLMEQLTTSLDELEQHLKNDKKLRTRKIRVKSLPTFGPHDIKAIRSKTKLSQSMLSEVIGVSPKTVEAWEQGKNRPSGSSTRILQLLNNDPNLILKEVTEKPNDKVLH